MKSIQIIWDTTFMKKRCYFRWLQPHVGCAFKSQYNKPEDCLQHCIILWITPSSSVNRVCWSFCHQGNLFRDFCLGCPRGLTVTDMLEQQMGTRWVQQCHAWFEWCERHHFEFPIDKNFYVISGTKFYVDEWRKEMCHDDDGVSTHQFLKIHTMRFCMTDLTEVLRRCTTLPDPTSSWEKYVSGENGCWSEVPLPCFVAVMKKCQQKIRAILGVKGSHTATLTHRLLAIMLAIPKYWNLASLNSQLQNWLTCWLKPTGGDAWMSRPKIQLTWWPLHNGHVRMSLTKSGIGQYPMSDCRN